MTPRRPESEAAQAEGDLEAKDAEQDKDTDVPMKKTEQVDRVASDEGLRKKDAGNPVI
jgi:hypothetical protein